MTDVDVAEQKPPYLWAAFVFLGALVLYVATLAPTTQFWDTSEYIAAAKVLGIPHPPGNPLFTLMAHVWGMLPLAAAYAARINLFAATTSAVAAACWFLVSERWLRPIVPPVGPRRLAALAGTLAGATAFTVWNQSVVNEKVYTLSLLSIALILWLIVRWDDQPAGQAHDHHLLLIVYLLALTSTNHMMGVLIGPVVAVLLFPPLMQRRAATDEGRTTEWAQWMAFCSIFAVLIGSGMEKAIYLQVAGVIYILVLAYAFATGNWRFTLAVLGVMIAGISVYIFLPIRAAHFPPINEGEPTNWQALWAVLTRQQYGKPPIYQRQADFVAQILMWVQYFTWQWGHDFAQNVRAGLAVVFGGLGVLGAWRHWRADRRQAIAMMSVMFTLTLLLIFYLNFKYGYSEYLPRSLPREVRERDYFFVCSFALWGIWVGFGLATLMEWLQDGLRERFADDAKRWSYAVPVLAVALVPLFGNRLTASRAHETLARDFAVDLLNSVEPYGILVTAGDNDTFPLWYAQEVEGVRKDVVLINLSLANTDWYLRQMQRRPVFPYDSAAGPAMYRGHTWPMPTGKVLEFTMGELDSLELYYPLAGKQVLNLNGIHVTLDPNLVHPLGNGQGYLEKADVIVLEAIKDQLGKRPIFFSRTVGTYADEFGLTPNLEGLGFVRALRLHPLVASDSIQALPGFGWVNVPRTKELAFDVYHVHAAARPRPRGWVDRPSEGILGLYGLTYAALAQVLQGRDPQGMERAIALADSINSNSQDFRSALPPMPAAPPPAAAPGESSR
jgi:Protein O-mannosyl-transferase TMEM260-like